MGDAEVARDTSQPFLLRPDNNLRPAVLRDYAVLRPSRVSAHPLAPADPQYALRVEEGHQRQSNNVYLA